MNAQPKDKNPEVYGPDWSQKLIKKATRICGF